MIGYRWGDGIKEKTQPFLCGAALSVVCMFSVPVWVPWLPALLARLISDSKLVVGMSVNGCLSCVLALG